MHKLAALNQNHSDLVNEIRAGYDPLVSAIKTLSPCQPSLYKKD